MIESEYMSTGRGSGYVVCDGMTKCKNTNLCCVIEWIECELLQKLIESELSSGDSVVTEFDGYLKKEWSLFLETKQEIKVNRYCTNRGYKILSKLIAFALVKYEEGEAAKGNDSVLKRRVDIHILTPFSLLNDKARYYTKLPI